MKEISLFLCRRGSVMVEGIVVLPVFIVILSALILYHRRFAAQLEANNVARRCAWKHSVSGCADQAPPNCSIASATTLSSQPLAAESSLQLFSEGASVLGTAARASVGMREGIAARPNRSFARPSLFGGGERSVRGRITVACNEREREVPELAKEVYCALGELGPGQGVTLPGCGGA